MDPMSVQEATMFGITKMPDDDMIFEMRVGSADNPAMMTITYTRE